MTLSDIAIALAAWAAFATFICLWVARRPR